ncbi:MAG TPA: Spy/CpxP family protein refolding chaperone [Verrucomicrobiae bacterium]|nr:Spy/CpxP family protein refolding chaperone [Verrucomicrobiae bacterium]
MQTHTKALIGAGIVAALTVGGFFAFLAHADTTNDVGFAAKGRFAHRLAQLGVTDQQKAQVKTILRGYQPTLGPLITEVVTERRALRDTIRAQTVDETAIRAEAAKVASLEADLAVERAHVVHDIRAVLTPEQIQKLKDMQIDADARFDTLLQRIANRIATD